MPVNSLFEIKTLYKELLSKCKPPSTNMPAVTIVVVTTLMSLLFIELENNKKTKTDKRKYNIKGLFEDLIKRFLLLKYIAQIPPIYNSKNLYLRK